MGTSIMAANIAAIYVESFLYGLFFILSMASIYLILKYDGEKGTKSSRSTSILRRPMLLGTILLFFIITTHWILTFVRLFQAYVYFRGGTQADVFFNSDIELTEIMQIGFFSRRFGGRGYHVYLSPVGYLESQHLRCDLSHLYRLSLDSL